MIPVTLPPYFQFLFCYLIANVKVLELALIGSFDHVHIVVTVILFRGKWGIESLKPRSQASSCSLVRAQLKHTCLRAAEGKAP